MRFKTLLSKATYSAFRLYIFFYQYVCSLGIEPTTFCAANTKLYYPWATEIQRKKEIKYQNNECNRVLNVVCVQILSFIIVL